MDAVANPAVAADVPAADVPQTGSRWLTAWVLYFGLAVAGYLFCTTYKDGAYALKYYPVVNEFHFDPSGLTPAQQVARTKFCNTAVMVMALALPVLLVGLALPRRVAPFVHVAAWGVLLVCSVLFIHNQLEWFTK
ncbi:MAG: hypothetical protein BIFFINMI_02323 [Phycisphaerae bacterium]|nr:hypothetical protein [Phycisphaerae bacterium]